MITALIKPVVLRTVGRTTHSRGQRSAIQACLSAYRVAPVCTMNFQGPGSDELRSKSCAGLCSKSTPLSSDNEIEDSLRALPAWSLSPDKKMIIRHFVAKNFSAAVKFFAEVAEVANEEGHHPDLHLTNYRDVRIELTTHAIGGLSQADFILAAKLDALPVEYSPKWLERQSQARAEAGH